MSMPGYYRFPAIYRDTLVFAADDDLWSVPASGGTARRLTANLSAIQHPYLSPDGKTLAFTAREEGHLEVSAVPAAGGPLRRMTYLGATSNVVGWSADGTRILFSSNAGQPFERVGAIHGVPAAGGLPERWPMGPAVSLSLGSGGRMAIGRHNNDPARWKRYRGGTAGEIWVDAQGSGEFRPLIRLDGNMGRPMWIGDRIYFLSDHEGFGNLYSCTPDGEDLARHTHHDDYFARFPNTDGARIVYHAGAELYLYNPAADSGRRVDIEYHSPRVQRQRKFVDAARYLEGYAPHPQGHSLAVTTRGKSFTLGNWEGAVIAQDDADDAPVRHRLTRWLNDGKRVIAVSDRSGEERLEIHVPGAQGAPDVLGDLDIGNVYDIKVSPAGDKLLLSNHRHELLFVDLEGRTLQRIARSEFQPINGFDWSPDGKWAAFGFSTSLYSTMIKLWNRETRELHAATEPVLRDVEPAFDPDGRYLYFLGARELNPVYDNLQFELGFPRGMKPYLITLRADESSPFLPAPRPLDDAEPQKPQSDAEREPFRIDVDGIERRVLALPVAEGIFRQIAGITGKVLFTHVPAEGALDRDFMPGELEAKGTLDAYDFKSRKVESIAKGISDFRLSQDGKTLVYRAGRKLRALKAGQKVDDPASKGGDATDRKAAAGRESGWIDLARVKVSVDPGAEWQQMAREAWRLQREHFWTEDMSRVDWQAVWERYAPLIERIGTRAEFSDLMWEMQGELGTSHAYEMGGDYRTEPAYPQGFLGADFSYDHDADTFRIDRIVHGTAGEADADSPLGGPGAGISPGDKLLAINGRRVSATSPPGALLVHQAAAEVVLSVGDSSGAMRDVRVKTLKSEFPARYREWVEHNRRAVHAASNGQIGYVHIPDMGPNGFAHFHRLYLVEAARDGLIVDVRFNSGGHVSQLLIEKLSRRPLGYDISRWGQPEPYPLHAVPGPVVALTNEWAGSDGDIFSHVFKLLSLGPLIGKRTWGGVIGISPRRSLADGAVTTQPEYSFWFKDVGWGVENYGTDPDIEVEMAPQDYAHGRDPQLDRAIAVALEKLAAEPVVRPGFGDRPNLAVPKLRR
jgi:tricorn protease